MQAHQPEAASPGLESPPASSPAAETERRTLQLIAEGATDLGGFGVAAISVRDGDELVAVAAAGDDPTVQDLIGVRAPLVEIEKELVGAESWGSLLFMSHERNPLAAAHYAWVPEFDVLDTPDAWHPEDLLCALLRDASGEICGMLSLDLPRTRRRPDAAQRHVLEVYTAQACHAVVAALERGTLARGLEQERELNAYRGRLIDVLSHDLQNPVTAIRAHLEMLADDPDVSGATQHSVRAMTRAADRITDMVHDLLSLARITGQRREAPEAVDLGLLVHETVELLSMQAEQQQVGVVISADDGPLPVTAHRGDLASLAENLVSNAIKYSEPGGRVELTLSRETTPSRTWVRWVVADCGIGISEADQARLFQEFFRSADPQVRARVGNGLGLSIVRAVVTRLGGRLDLTSRLGVGTTVVIRLPAG